jgi:transposase
MFTHCYKNKKSKQFMDFIERIELLYHDSSIKKIFIVLDNASIHRSKKVIQILKRYHSRISFVFLPTRSPELNLIEVRWMWMQRQAINNSTFTNEGDIGKAVSDWTDNYNKTHRKINSYSLQRVLTGLFT